MNEKQFLAELRNKLSGLPQEDIEERIAFYGEMIEDRMEEGVSEEEAVAGIGTVDSVVQQIMSEVPLTKLVRERVRPKTRRKTWEIVLLVLGAPVWIPLIIAAFAVLLSLYIVIWAVVISFYAADFALAAGAVSGLVMAFVYGKAESLTGALFFVGAGMTCAGFAILLFFACLWLMNVIRRLTGRILLGIKTSFIGKETERDE